MKKSKNSKNNATEISQLIIIDKRVFEIFARIVLHIYNWETLLEKRICRPARRKHSRIFVDTHDNKILENKYFSHKFESILFLV